jgi:hypothetical protein
MIIIMMIMTMMMIFSTRELRSSRLRNVWSPSVFDTLRGFGLLLATVFALHGMFLGHAPSWRCTTMLRARHVRNEASVRILMIRNLVCAIGILQDIDIPPQKRITMFAVSIRANCARPERPDLVVAKQVQIHKYSKRQATARAPKTPHDHR